MKIIYTKHALGKFQHLSIIKLGIKRKHVQETIMQPERVLVEEDQITHLKVIDEKHTLKVVFKKVSDIILVITFHPAQKGRYEKR